jgi:hypothetical protein
LGSELIVSEFRAGGEETSEANRIDENRSGASERAHAGEGVRRGTDRADEERRMRGGQEERWKRRRKGHTLNVTSRLSPSSNTVDLTCFPSSIKVMPTYKETLSINLKTPSALITD